MTGAPDAARLEGRRLDLDEVGDRVRLLAQRHANINGRTTTYYA